MMDVMDAAASLISFFKVLSSSDEAKKLVDEAFEQCRGEECMACIRSKIEYWYYMWLFNVMYDPIIAAKDIHKCIER